MTAIELVEVMEEKTFIAVKLSNGRISYSGSAGSAKKFGWLGKSCQVINVKVGIDENSATIISVA